MIDEGTIGSYFFLQNRINKTMRRMDEEAIQFKHRNFYTCIQQVDEGIATVAFKVDREVIDYVCASEQAKKHLEILQFKLMHLKRYLKSLTYSERMYLYNRYRNHWPAVNDRLDKEVTEEIAEIEEAVTFRYGREWEGVTKTETKKAVIDKTKLPSYIEDFLKV